MSGPDRWPDGGPANTQDGRPANTQDGGSASPQDSRPAALIDRAIADGVIPGAVLAAGRATAEPLLLHVAGDAQRDDAAVRPMTADTVFDLASLTKVVATLPCLLHLIAAGQVGLDDPVTRYLDARRLGARGKDRVTVRHLLTHTSGLPDHRKYYEYLHDPAEVRAAALAEALTSTPGSSFCYSDIGFILAGELAAAVAGADLAKLTAAWVCAPLGLTTTRFGPLDPSGPIAATERVQGQAKVGVVHDENAEALGGIAGHAGLFGTVTDLAAYAAAWAGPADVLAATGISPALRAEAVRCQTDGLGARRGLGWGLRGDPYDNMGDGWLDSGAGHTGFTGTSLSFDPVSGLWAVLLTNAVHFGRGPEHSVKELRKQVHAAVAADLLA